MRTVLVGAVESTAVALRAMIRAHVAPSAVVTLPLAKADRHSDFVDLRPLAREGGVPVLESAQVNSAETLADLRRLDLDHLLVIGWSQILSPELLGLPRRGTIGYHPAPLPELRGRAVIPWTILLRRAVTGSTLFWIDEGVDSGDILGQRVFGVDESESAETLYAKHMDALDALLTEMLPLLASGTAPRTPQDHTRATWCARRTAADGFIDWRCSADEIWTLIRAVGKPYPGAWTVVGGRRVVIWSAERVDEAPYYGTPGQIQQLGEGAALVACGGGGFIRMLDVQMEGSPTARASDVFRLHQRLGWDPGFLGSVGGTK